MQLMKGLAAFASLCTLLPGCSSSPESTLLVRVADELLAITANPMTQLSEERRNGLSRGVYFQFRELKCPPVSMFDLKYPVDRVALSYPDLVSDPSVLGDDPLSSSFSVDTSSLDPKAFYQVEMFVLDTGIPSDKTFRGYSDCPLYLDLKELNRVVICFGNRDGARTCREACQDFKSCCPAPTAPCQ